MKQLQVWFEDKDHEELLKVKEGHGAANWRDFILDLARTYQTGKRK